MSIGLPYLTSDFELYEELTKDTQAGFTVNPERPEEIAEQIKTLFLNKEELERASLLGPNQALEKYNWKTEEKRLIELYQRLN